MDEATKTAVTLEIPTDMYHRFLDKKPDFISAQTYWLCLLVEGYFAMDGKWKSFAKEEMKRV